MNHFSMLVDKLENAKKTGKAVSQLTNENPELSLNEAYEIQAQLVKRMGSYLGKISGLKLGLTSFAKQRDVKVFETIRGVLLEKMEVQPDSTISTQGMIHPRFEPEVAVKLARPIEELSFDGVIGALAWAGPAIEIIDSRYQDFQFNLVDVVADNTSASGFILGKSQWKDLLDEVRLYGVVVKKNGKIMATGAPAAVLNDPINAVLSLEKTLRKEGARIEPGLVILTGGITQSVTFEKGDKLEVEWPGETISFFAS
jgi:2-oxo-3-hexenedioate decarboxylase